MEPQSVTRMSALVFVLAFLTFVIHMIWPDTINRFSFLVMYFIYLIEVMRR